MGYGKSRRPNYGYGTDRTRGFTVSTAASTALAPRGLHILVTAQTSSETSDVYTLLAPKAGDQIEMVAKTVASSSVSPIHINSAAMFSYSSASTGHDMVTLSSAGAAFSAIAYSSSEWMVTGIRAATFSTST